MEASNATYAVSGLGEDKVPPVLVVQTDGGPDHNLTFGGVIASYVALWLHLDLDVLVAMRTAPQNSCTNPVERSMSTLNYSVCGHRAYTC